jgi:hypothetical protein
MRNNTRKVQGKADVYKRSSKERTTVNKIRPRIMHPRYTDDSTLRFIVTKTYVEEGQQLNIIEDDSLHFAIRAGEIWIEPEDGFNRRKTRKTARKKAKAVTTKKISRKK